MRSYVDDFFGGPVRSKKGLEADEINAKVAFDCLIAVGELTGAIMKPEKCGPRKEDGYSWFFVQCRGAILPVV